MENRELLPILNAYFNWNKSRMYCFVGMLVALIKVRTINLTELACGFSSLASIESRYRRIRRFFKEFKIDFMQLAAWVIHFFDISGQSLTLSMDRTNWKWGTKDINILMLQKAQVSMLGMKNIAFIVWLKALQLNVPQY